MTEDEHVYLSTACHHEIHEECRKQCKFCEVDCACDCHVEDAETTVLTSINDKLDGLAEQYAAILKSYEAIQSNYAGVAHDVEKIKTALNIDVESPPPGG
jgi:hypothetical protein